MPVYYSKKKRKKLKEKCPNCVEIDSPLLVDLWETRKRGAQGMLLKDIGYLIAKTSISQGWKVVEIGGGIGSVTIYLANIVKPTGKVIVYEKDDRWIKVIDENLRRVGLREYVEIKRREIGKEDIDESEVDLIFADVPNPEEVFEKVKNKVKKHRFIVFFVIHFEKVSNLLRLMEENDFYEVEAVKVGEEKVFLTPRGARFEISGVKFTGFLVFGRRLR